MLQITNLSKRFGGPDGVQAVDDVSLTVERGRIVGFVGPNGAGKSTTMRSVFGLVRPDRGSITWHGDPVTPRTTSRFGYMPEQRGLYPKMKIADQVSFFAQLKGQDAAGAGRDAEEILTALGLGDRLKDPLEKLSHGNQQRVQLAVSLVNSPELLILDEPFNGLDPMAVVTLQRVLEERVAEGTGILFSSHQLDLVERLCDEVVLIGNGLVKASGTVREVRAASGSRIVEIEMEESSQHLGDHLGRTAPDGATVTEAGPSTATVEVVSGDVLPALLDTVQSAGTLASFTYDLPPLETAFTRLVGSAPEVMV